MKTVTIRPATAPAIRRAAGRLRSRSSLRADARRPVDAASQLRPCLAAYGGDAKGVVSRTSPAGLSDRNPCATAHCITSSMRCLIRRASSIEAQIGSKTASRSAAVTASTRRFPMRCMA